MIARNLFSALRRSLTFFSWRTCE